MLFYHGLFEQGGTPKQREVWKKQYKRRIWNYGQSKCPELERKMANSRTASKPVPVTPGTPG